MNTTPKLDKRQKRMILISMCTALIAVIASVSGLNVAQRDMAVSLSASAGDILWIINAYTLALASLLLPIGAIGDKWGRKPVLLTGMVVFGVATLTSAFSTTVTMMIVSRAFAGVGAAMVMPVTLSVITSSFPEEERAQAIGVWAGFAGSGGILGLFVSSFMVDYVTWRWAFALPVILMVAAAVLAFRFVPNSRENEHGSFDVVGSILSAVAVGGLVLGIHEGPEQGWTAPITLGALIVGVLALVAFVWWELRVDDPLLDVTTFANRGLASGTLTLTLLFAVMFGIFLVLFPYFQTVLGWSALHSAVGLLPMAFMMMPMSTVAPRIAARIGSRHTMMTGLAFAFAGLATMALTASVEGGYWSVLPGLMLIGLGMGLTMTPSTEAITATLPADKQGVASALNDTSREFGGSIGIALLGSILTSGYTSAIHGFASQLPPALGGPVGEDYFVALGVAQQTSQTDPTLAAKIFDAAEHAFVQGWTGSMWVGAAIVAVAFVFVTVRGPRRGEVMPEVERVALVS